MGRFGDALARYAEFVLFAAAIYVVRDTAWELVIVLAALCAALMTSYAMAKAAALQKPAPRGFFQEPLRLALLVMGLGLDPVTASLGTFPHEVLVLGVAVIAVVGNVDALLRFVRIGQSLR